MEELSNYLFMQLSFVFKHKHENLIICVSFAVIFVQPIFISLQSLHSSYCCNSKISPRRQICLMFLNTQFINLNLLRHLFRFGFLATDNYCNKAYVLYFSTNSLITSILSIRALDVVFGIYIKGKIWLYIFIHALSTRFQTY